MTAAVQCCKYSSLSRTSLRMCVTMRSGAKVSVMPSCVSTMLWLSVTCLMQSTMACWTCTSNCLILSMNVSLLGHCTAHPRSNRSNSCMFSTPALLSGSLPSFTQSGTTRRTWHNSSSYRALIFLMMMSILRTRTDTLPKHGITPWCIGSGSICNRISWIRIPSVRSSYSASLSAFSRQELNHVTRGPVIRSSISDAVAITKSIYLLVWSVLTLSYAKLGPFWRR